LTVLEFDAVDGGVAVFDFGDDGAVFSVELFVVGICFVRDVDPDLVSYIRHIVERVRQRSDIDVLVFPFASGFDFSLTAFGDGVDVGAAVFLSFFDQAFFDECVEVGVEASVVDL